MRAIIIDDKDAKALLDRLMLAKFEHIRGVNEDDVVQQVHRKFHYVVSVWLQEQGAATT